MKKMPQNDVFFYNLSICAASVCQASSTFQLSLEGNDVHDLPYL